MERTLWESIQRLAPLAPRFVSVTYGADGSTRERTHNIGHAHPRARPPLTAGAAPDLHRRAARGDPRHRARLLGRGRAPHRRAARRCAGGAGDLRSRIPDGFAYAADLVRGLQDASATSTSRWPPTPRCTPRRRTRTSTSTTCRRKIDAGAKRAITQFFFDTDAFLRFRDRCAARGHHAPDRARHPADHALPADAALREALRRERAGLAAAALRRPRRRSGHAPPDRGQRRDRAGAPAAGARRPASSTSTR